MREDMPDSEVEITVETCELDLDDETADRLVQAAERGEIGPEALPSLGF